MESATSVQVDFILKMVNVLSSILFARPVMLIMEIVLPVTLDMLCKEETVLSVLEMQETETPTVKEPMAMELAMAAMKDTTSQLKPPVFASIHSAKPTLQLKMSARPATTDILFMLENVWSALKFPVQTTILSA